MYIIHETSQTKSITHVSWRGGQAVSHMFPVTFFGHEYISVIFGPKIMLLGSSEGLLVIMRLGGRGVGLLLEWWAWMLLIGGGKVGECFQRPGYISKHGYVCVSNWKMEIKLQKTQGKLEESAQYWWWCWGTCLGFRVHSQICHYVLFQI